MIEKSYESVEGNVSYSGNVKNKMARKYSLTHSRPPCASFASRTAFGMAVARLVVLSRQPIPDSSAATFTASICGVNYKTKLVSSLKIDVRIRT
jgi:hypothetical protein